MSPPAPKASGSVGAKVETPIPPVPAKKDEPKKPDAAAAAPADAADAPTEWVYKGTLGLQWGTNGKNDGYLFDSSWGKFGDHFNTHLDAGLMHDVNRGNVRFRVGGQLNGDFWRGDHSTSGANLNALTLGPRVELDWRRAIPWDNIGIFSRLGVFYGLGYGWGTTPAQTISLHDQSGLAMVFGADLNLFNVNIRNVELGLDAVYTTPVIDGSKFNSEGNFLGFGFTIRPAVRKPEVVKVPEPTPPPPPQCDEITSLLEGLRAEINGKGDQKGLKDQIAEKEKLVAEKRELLKTRAIDPLDDAAVLSVLRTQRASEYSQKDLVGLDPKKDEAKIKEIQASAAAKAATDFPDGYNFWEPKTAKIEDKELVIPDPLPTDCTELSKLLGRVTKARDNLASRLNELNKIYETPFPPRIRQIIETKLPSFKTIHFEDDRPKPADVTAFGKALKANQAKNGGKVNWDDPAMRKAMTPIFGATYVPDIIKTIRETGAVLNQEGVKEIKNMEVQGHTSLAGSDQHNMGLSDRRANIVRDMLIAEGVDGSRLSAKGYGENQPTCPQEETLPAKSAGRAACAGDNRRIELTIPPGEIERVEKLGVSAPAIGGSKKVDKPADKKPADKKEDKPAAPPPPPPAKKDGLDWGKK